MSKKCGFLIAAEEESKRFWRKQIPYLNFYRVIRFFSFFFLFFCLVSINTHFFVPFICLFYIILIFGLTVMIKNIYAVKDE